MARKNILVLIPQPLMEGLQVDVMDPKAWLYALRAPAERNRLDSVGVVDLSLDRARGCYMALLQSESYPDLADYERAPEYPYDAPEVVPSGT